MTDLRTAAQQALEALESAVEYDYHGTPLTETHAGFNDAANALRAALAEPVQLGCDHCNQPLYAAVKCRVCGRVTEPVQEPVAWLFTNLQSGDYDFCYQEDEHDHDREMWHKQPLYTAPPQRKPLSDADLAKIWDDALDQLDQRDQLRFIARAIERAHGITE